MKTPDYVPDYMNLQQKVEDLSYALESALDLLEALMGSDYEESESVKAILDMVGWNQEEPT